MCVDVYVADSPACVCVLGSGLGNIEAFRHSDCN